MTNLVLSANTCFANKNWPRPEQWVECVKSWGLRSVQCSLDLLDPLLPDARQLAAEMGRAAEAAGVEIWSTFTGSRAYATNMLGHSDARYRDWARTWLLAAVEVTAAMGARATGGHIAALEASCAVRDASVSEGRLAPALIRSLAGDCAEIGRRAVDVGLEYLMLEAMPGARELPHTPRDVRDLLGAINEVSPAPFELCYDLGHACGSDLRPDRERAYAWLEEMLPFIRCVHLQQTDGLGDRHWPFTEEHTGDGIISPARVLQVLAGSARERIDLVFEIIHPPEAGPEEILADWAESVTAWRTATREGLPA